jgi:hypothetical protein
MAEIAVVIIEPGDRRSAQLLDNNRPVRELLSLLLERLRLPKNVNYHLIPAAFWICTLWILSARRSGSNIRLPAVAVYWT